jgi:hypothetical protein
MPTDLRKDIRPHHRDFIDDKDERPRVARAKGVKALTLQRLWMVRRSRFSAATPVGPNHNSNPNANRNPNHKSPPAPGLTFIRDDLAQGEDNLDVAVQL